MTAAPMTGLAEGAPAGETLILAYHFLSAEESGAARPARFAKYLGRQGVGVHVVTERPPRITRADSNAYCTGPTETAPALARWGSMLARHLQRRLLPYNECLPWTPLAVARASEIIRRTNITSILSTSPPLATHFAALELKRRFGLRWLADFRDPLLDNPFRNRKFARPYDRAIEVAVFHFADVIIANTDTVGQLWRRRYPQWAHKIHVIWNGYDPDDDLGPLQTPARPWKVIAHVGSLYGERRPDILLESLLRLIRSGSVNPAHVRLRLIGPMENAALVTAHPTFVELTALGCLEVFAGSVQQTLARKELRSADLLVLFDLNGAATSLQVPAKLFDYIRIGRPVLAFTPANSPTERILAGSGIPNRCITPLSAPEAVDARLASFLAFPIEQTPPTEWFVNEFSAPFQAISLRDLLSR